MSRGRGAENGMPLCFTVLVKGTGRGQALCPRASDGHTCAWRAEEVALPGQWKGRAWHQVRGHVPTRATPICFILSHFLQGGQDQLLLSACPAPGCCLPCFSPQVYELLLFTAVEADWTCSGWKVWISQAIGFCPEIPKLSPERARKASLLGLSICLSFSWLVTVVSNPIPER